MSGYVRLYRDLIGHPAFRNEAEAMAFAWLFARAAWRGARVRYKGHGIALERGQLALSLRDMAAAFDRDKAWVERLFKRLRAERMIETRTATGVTVITICNYDKFQPFREGRETEGEAEGETGPETRGETRAETRVPPAAGLARDSEQASESIQSRDSHARKGARRAARLPQDFVVPEDWRDFAQAERRWSAAEIEIEAASFCDYWRARGGREGAKLDWQATWRNWVRGARRPDGAAAPGPPPDAAERRAAELRTAGIYERMGRDAEAAEIRRRWTSADGGTAIGAVIARGRQPIVTERND